MFEINPLSGHPGDPAFQAHRAADASTQRRAAVNRPANDRVELSPAARDYHPEAEAARRQNERIPDLRQRIAKGTYLTPEKIDYVIDRLHAELCGAVPDVA